MIDWESFVAATTGVPVSKIAVHPAVIAVESSSVTERLAFLREHVRRAEGRSLATGSELALYGVLTRILDDASVPWSDADLSLLIEGSDVLPLAPWSRALLRSFEASACSPLLLSRAWIAVRALLRTPRGMSVAEALEALAAALRASLPFGEARWAARVRAHVASWAPEARATFRRLVATASKQPISMRRVADWCGDVDDDLDEIGEAALDALLLDVLNHFVASIGATSDEELEDACVLHVLVSAAWARQHTAGVPQALGRVATEAFAPVREGGCFMPKLGYRALAVLAQCRTPNAQPALQSVLASAPEAVRRRARLAGIGGC